MTKISILHFSLDSCPLFSRAAAPYSPGLLPLILPGSCPLPLPTINRWLNVQERSCHMESIGQYSLSWCFYNTDVVEIVS